MGVLTRLTKRPKAKGVSTGCIRVVRGGRWRPKVMSDCLLSCENVAAGFTPVYKKSEGSLRVARSVVPGL